MNLILSDGELQNIELFVSAITNMPMTVGYVRQLLASHRALAEKLATKTKLLEDECEQTLRLTNAADPVKTWEWHDGDRERSMAKWTAEQKAVIAEQFGVTVEHIDAEIERVKNDRFVFNDFYQVHIHDAGPLWHLSLRNRENTAVHDWRDIQRIKNELIGEEHEAVELYPAESRLIDTANQYHLWVWKDPTFRLPFGFNGRRAVLNDSFGNSKQRPR